MRVGYFTRTRPWQVYAYSNPPDGWRYSRAMDIPFASLGVTNLFLQNTKFHFNLAGFDLLQTYNGIIPYGPDWLVEVESYFPRYHRPLKRWQFEFAVERLCSRSCLAITFTSEMSLALNKPLLKEYDLLKKSSIIYRPVVIPRLEEIERSDRSTFNVIFVGNAFFRKGGVELLAAFTSQAKDDWRLKLISALTVDWRKYPSSQEISNVRKTIASDPRVTLLEGLSQSEVRQQLCKADVFVGTTFADPWYNAIAEAAACGLPVISTNISAIPEMVVPGQTGELIDLNGKTSYEIAVEIGRHLRTYYDDTELRRTHGLNARQLAQNKFSIQSRNLGLKAAIQAH